MMAELLTTVLVKKIRASLETAYDLEKLAIRKGIPIIEPFRGLTDRSGCLRVLGPSESFYENLLPQFRGTPEPKSELGLLKKAFYEAKEFIKKIAEKWDFETLDDSGETSAENDSSTILHLSVDDRNIIFTADAGQPALNEVVDLLESEKFDFSTLNLVQVPHHGSQRNVGAFHSQSSS